MNAKSPEQKVREFYEAFADVTEDSAHARTVVYTIKKTLSMLGVQIAGVNADQNAETAEQKVIELFRTLSDNPTNDEYTFGVIDGIKDTLTLLGIKIKDVNA